MITDKVFEGYCKGFNDPTKYPKGNCGDGKKIYDYEEVKNLDCYGARCKSDVVDISFDDLDSESDLLSEAILDLLESRNIKTYALYSPHGVHTFWKIPEGMVIKDAISILACGVAADIHHGNTYIPIRCYGVTRDQVWKSIDDIPELPKMLYPVRVLKKDSLSDRGLWLFKEGSGRNNGLSSHAFMCAKAGLSEDEIRDVFHIINERIFKDRIDDNEIDTILRPETIEKLKRSAVIVQFYDEKKFLHNIMGDYIIERNSVIDLDGRLHIYNGKCYIGDADDKSVERMCSELIPTLSRHQRREVVDYIRLFAPSEKVSNARYITFDNGIYNIDEDRLIDFTPDIIDVTTIPWDYNPDAYSEIVDKTLDNLTCGDGDVRLLLEEAVGYTFYRRNELGAVFFIDGDGANGKSTFYSMIDHMLGKKNRSDLDITQLSNHFMTVNLYEKFANIGGDVTKCHMSASELAVFKKLATGDAITVDVKNSRSITFSNYAKMFFACNGMPNLTSDPAIMRRIKIIPFKAKFEKGVADNTIIDKLTTRESMEYLIQLGIRGLKRLLKNKAFTEPSVVTQAMGEYELDADSGKAFIADYGVDNIIGKTPKIVKSAYDEFCHDGGYKYPKTWKTVATMIRKEYHVCAKTAYVNGVRLAVYTQDEE